MFRSTQQKSEEKDMNGEEEEGVQYEAKGKTLEGEEEEEVKNLEDKDEG